MCKESIGNIKYNSIRDYATKNNSNYKQIIVKFDLLTRAVNLFQNMYFYFSKQFNSTGEIIMMHFAHRAVMVYIRYKRMPGRTTTIFPRYLGVS